MTESRSGERPVDTERTAVKTYVPAYQKEAWREHAADLDMSLSEFVRTMVQAGRRGFGADVAGEASAASGETRRADPAPAADGGRDLEERVVGALAGDGPLAWDDLLAAATGDVESRLEETLQALQADGRVQHNGRDGGYVLVDDER